MLCYQCLKKIPDNSRKCPFCGRLLIPGSSEETIPKSASEKSSSAKPSAKKPEAPKTPPPQPTPVKPAPAKPAPSKPASQEIRPPAKASPKPPRSKPTPAESTPPVALYNIGDIVANRYEVWEILGSGGLGTVYKVQDRGTRRSYVLKRILLELVNPEIIRRFQKEAARWIRIRHAQLVEVYSSGEDRGSAYFLREYLEGLSLDRLLQVRKTAGVSFSIDEIEPIFAQIALGLIELHRTIIHGDLKPQNIIILPDTLKIADFGMGRILDNPDFVSIQLAQSDNYYYLSPEIISDPVHIGKVSDIYSFGAILYEMMTNSVPRGEVVNPSRFNPNLNPKLDPVIIRALRESHSERYENILDLARDFYQAIGKELPAGFTPQSIDDLHIPDDFMEIQSSRLLARPPEPPLEIPPDHPSVAVPVVKPIQVPPEPPAPEPIPPLEPPAPEPPTSEPIYIPEPQAPEPAPIPEPPVPEPPAPEPISTPEPPAPEPIPPLEPPAPEPTREPETVPVSEPISTSQTPAPEMPTPPPAQPEEWKVPAPSPTPARSKVPLIAAVLGGIILLVAGGIYSLNQQNKSRLAREVKGKTQAIIKIYSELERSGASQKKIAAFLKTGSRMEELKKLIAAGEYEKAEAVIPAIAALVEEAQSELERELREREQKEFSAAEAAIQKAEASQEEATKAQAQTGAPEPFQLGGSKLEAARKALAQGKTPEAVSLAQAAKNAFDQAVKKAGKKAPAPESEKEMKTAQMKKEAAAAAAPAGKCPAGMAYVPAGNFPMGSSPDDSDHDYSELPNKPVNVPAYCIDVYEYPNKEGATPLTKATWYEAKKSCQANGNRLCTEPEWEKACKGTKNNKYPYGNRWDGNICNTQDPQGKERAVQAVGKEKKCKSDYGVYDLSGNVKEWTEDAFSGEISDRTVKGGSSGRPDWATRCANRENFLQPSRSPDLGFRCCRDAP